MHAAYNFVVLVRRVEENDRSVTQTDSDSILVGAVLNSKNNSYTLDVFFPFHGWCVVNADETHALLEQNNLVDLLEVENLFNVVVVGGFVFDISALGVAHVCITLRA